MALKMWLACWSCDVESVCLGIDAAEVVDRITVERSSLILSSGMSEDADCAWPCSHFFLVAVQ